MDKDLRNRLKIDQERLDEVNALLLDLDSRVINDFLAVVGKYGTVEEINRKAEEARKLSNLMGRLAEIDSPYLADLEWLIEQRDRGAFISVADYRRKLLGDRADAMEWDDSLAVTLEISAYQYFPPSLSRAGRGRPSREKSCYECTTNRNLSLWTHRH